jgi:hypothetical protein
MHFDINIKIKLIYLRNKNDVYWTGTELRMNEMEEKVTQK